MAGLQQGCLGQLHSLDLAVNGLEGEGLHVLLPQLFSPQCPHLSTVDVTFNLTSPLHLDPIRLQLSELCHDSGRAVPRVLLHRPCSVHIIRRPHRHHAPPLPPPQQQPQPQQPQQPQAGE